MFTYHSQFNFFINNQWMGHSMTLKLCIQDNDWLQHTRILTCVQHMIILISSCAAHEFLLAYNTRSLTPVLLTSMQHTTYHSHSAHEIWLECTTRILLASSAFCVTHMCWLSHSTKIEHNTCVRCTQVST